ncbi:hypothetical protein CRM22_008926 [Opisthorchis felineus]|uniref:Raptor N-terminal CASPase-like domain-containing protein n=1 Tax=Opisthorchis felineus TaxID=147828 RepID=A0A4S2LH52_OPIFE|nr:hypothetical protein CRM22_008926 [Opisthorchis felineus]
MEFTNYIPLSLYDLQRWLGAPSVYVFDYQNASRVIRMYEIFCRRRMAKNLAAAQRQQQTENSENRGRLTNLDNSAAKGFPSPWSQKYGRTQISGSNCDGILCFNAGQHHETLSLWMG